MKRISFLALALLFAFKIVAQPAIDPSLAETPFTAKTLSGTINGSLVMPKGASVKVPLVLIIADAGVTDRNGNNEKTGVNGYTYKLLANDLGLKGIATLRYDKRLVGVEVTKTKESQLHFQDYSDDATVLLTMLGDDERFAKIILFGHGEGALVAMIAAYEQPIVKAYISAEGVADIGDKVLRDQMKSKSGLMIDQFKAIMDSLRKHKTTDNVDPSLYYIARPSIQPFLMSWVFDDPIRIIKKIKVPLLFIQGLNDLLVTPDNGEKFKKAKSDAIYLPIKGMNHILKDAPADPDKNMETYSDPNLPLNKEMVAGVVDFINKLK
jgi:fermentation-respiration switch protein FrsA (DUF1100 family)